MMFADELRWVNVALGVTGLLWLVIRSIVRWDEYVYAIRLFLFTTGFYAFAVLLGSIEGLHQHLPFGIRLFAFLMANISLLLTMYLTQSKLSANGKV